MGSAAEKIAGLEDKVARQKNDLEGAALREQSSQEAADEVFLLRTRVVEVEAELKAEKSKVEALERGDQTMGREVQVSILISPPLLQRYGQLTEQSMQNQLNLANATETKMRATIDTHIVSPNPQSWQMYQADSLGGR